MIMEQQTVRLVSSRVCRDFNSLIFLFPGGRDTRPPGFLFRIEH